MIQGVVFLLSLLTLSNASCTSNYNFTNVNFRVYLATVPFEQTFNGAVASAACQGTNTSCGLNSTSCSNCLANSPWSKCVNNSVCECIYNGIYPACSSTPPTCLSTSLSCGSFPACNNCSFPSTCLNNTCAPPTACFQTNSSCGQAGSCQDCTQNNGICRNMTCVCQFGCNASAFPACPTQDCLTPNTCINQTCTGPNPPCFGNATSCGMPGNCLACPAESGQCINNVCKANCGNNASSCGSDPLNCQACLNGACVNQTCSCFGNVSSCTAAEGGGTMTCNSCSQFYTCQNQTCLPPPPCFSNVSSCGAIGSGCPTCIIPSTCINNTCIAPCAQTTSSCGQPGACLSCPACTVCSTSGTCQSCASVNTGGGSTACYNGQCDCAFDGATTASCGTFPLCKKCASGQICSLGNCINGTTSGGGGGGGGGCRSIDFVARAGPGGCFHKETQFSYKGGPAFTVHKIPSTVPCQVTGSVFVHGYTVVTNASNVLRLTGGHLVVLQNGTLVEAKWLTKGLLLDEKQHVVNDPMQHNEPQWFYDVQCEEEGQIVANGILCK